MDPAGVTIAALITETAEGNEDRGRQTFAGPGSCLVIA
jgi:hypothetical protein